MFAAQSRQTRHNFFEAPEVSQWKTQTVSRLLARLKECSRLGDLQRGKELHSEAIAGGALWNKYVVTSLINMYGKCGRMGDARELYDGFLRSEVAPLTALLQGYVENGESERALELFDWLSVILTDFVPDGRVFVAVLSACRSLAAEVGDKDKCRVRGNAYLLQAVKNKCCDVFVMNTAIDLFANCCSMADARGVFDNMADRDTVSWNSLITGYVENGESKEGLKLLRAMVEDGLVLNSRTFVAALKACGNLQDLETGRALHEEICSRGLQREVIVANSLVDFYGKCGRMGDAEHVFESIPRRTAVSWTALMCGYGLQGESKRVLELFEKMKSCGVKPDHATFTCVLAACSHAGLTTRGKDYFELMQKEYRIAPTVKHYACMVDLLGRADDTGEAFAFVESMPVKPDAVIWKTLLAACVKGDDALAGKLSYAALVKLSDKDPAAYNLLANVLGSQQKQ